MIEGTNVPEPAKVRGQTDEEIRGRLKRQGKLKSVPEKKDEGVRKLSEEESLQNIEERKERKEREAGEDTPGVRTMTKKDVILRQAKEKERNAEGKDEDGEKQSRVQTQEDITARNDGEPEPKPEPEPEPEPEQDAEPKDDAEPKTESESEPPEIFGKDIVTFEDDDGETITGKVKRVTSKNEAIIDTKDAEYTVPLDLLKKVEKKEKK